MRKKFFKSSKVVFSEFFRELGVVIKFVDVGARHDLPWPWCELDPRVLNVVGFEPDPDEAKRLIQLYPNRKYFPCALWSSEETRPFYLYEWESTSSMYPPNEELAKRYDERHWSGRRIAKTYQVKCNQLDEILQNEEPPDFIKLDTQGAEFEILCGARKTLDDYSPLVIAETWTVEVYKDAPLAHEVIGLMHDFGYQIFDVNIAAAWTRRNGAQSIVNSRQEIVGLDFLFIKRIEKLDNIGNERLLKLIILCEFFGFRSYALQLLELGGSLDTGVVETLRNEMNKNSAREQSRIGKLLRLFEQKIGRQAVFYPPLH